MGQHYELIIVGLGSMGSAALYQATQRGVKVLGLDQYEPPHEMGSHHAETRITRLSVGEGAQYIPLVRRSHAIWRELEARTGRKILWQNGGYVVCPAEGSAGFHGEQDEDFVAETARFAERFGLAYRLPTAAEIREHVPPVLMPDDTKAYYEPTGGVVLCQEAVRTQLELAELDGATIQTSEAMLRYETTADGVTVYTEKGEYTADKLIISAGAWASNFLPQKQKALLKVLRQVVYWFEAEDITQFYPDKFPFFIWIGRTLDDYFCPFPVPPNGTQALKMMTEQFVDVSTAETVNREVTQAEIDYFFEHYAQKRIKGLTGRCLKARVCLYTNTPDDHFFIDWHPEDEHVLVASPCSGHGFKHSAAIGEMLVEMAVAGRSTIDQRPFRFDRLG